MDADEILRRQLVEGLRGDNVHMPLEATVEEFPDWAINGRAPNVSYTPWHLLEHIRITQWDILEYIRNPDHESPRWPVGYWPAPDEEATREELEATVAGFVEDRTALEAMVRDPSIDLLAPLPHAPRHTILREVRIVGNHNSYHLGEFAILRQVMGSWGPSHRD